MADTWFLDPFPDHWGNHISFSTATGNGFSDARITSVRSLRACQRCGATENLVRAPGRWTLRCRRCTAGRELRRALESALDLPRLLLAYLLTR